MGIEWRKSVISGRVIERKKVSEGEIVRCFLYPATD